MSNKPDNTIAIDGTPSEMDRAAMGLTMDDFFGAVREIRENGVPFYDEEHDACFTIKVDMAELAKHDPEIFDPGESLEATLYGVFEAIHLQDPAHRGCETRGYFDEHWKYLKSDRKMKKFPPEFIAYRALVGALSRWLHVIMEPILVKQVQELSEEDVLKKCNEIDGENGKQNIN